MKNIIFISMLNIWSMDNKKGAPSFFKTLEGYYNNGWNISIICPKTTEDSIKSSNDFSGIKIYSFKQIFAPFRKIPKLGFVFSLLNIKHSELMFYFLAKKAFFACNQAGIVYAYEVHGVKPGKKLSKKYNLPLITRFQGTILEPIKSTIINRVFNYPHFNALSEDADVLIMTNDGTKGDVVLKRLNNNSKKVLFWRNGVDLLHKKLEYSENELIDLKKSLGIDVGEKVFLTVSRLAPWKKVDRAIVGFAKHHVQTKNTKLVIVGEGPERKRLEDLCSKLNISNEVIFVGAIPHRDIAKYMMMANVFLSLYDLSNVGNPLLEAMICAKPIITINTGDTKSIIQNNHNGILLELENIDQLPTFMSKLIQDESFSKTIGLAAEKFARENFWTWEDRINVELIEINKLYEKWSYQS